jgi:hypothetical protein
VKLDIGRSQHASGSVAGFTTTTSVPQASHRSRVPAVAALFVMASFSALTSEASKR